jgi:hypothetical protein
MNDKKIKCLVAIGLMSLFTISAYAGGIHCPPGDPGDGKCLPINGNFIAEEKSVLESAISLQSKVLERSNFARMDFKCANYYDESEDSGYRITITESELTESDETSASGEVIGKNYIGKSLAVISKLTMDGVETIAKLPCFDSGVVFNGPGTNIGDRQCRSDEKVIHRFFTKWSVVDDLNSVYVSHEDNRVLKYILHIAPFIMDVTKKPSTQVQPAFGVRLILSAPSPSLVLKFDDRIYGQGEAQKIPNGEDQSGDKILACYLEQSLVNLEE